MTAENIGRTLGKAAPAKDAPLAPGAVVSAATPAACGGDPWVETPTEYDGILLASFGGPESQDDVIPFLRTSPRVAGSPTSASKRSRCTTATTVA
jgi:ferrochelatase